MVQAFSSQNLLSKYASKMCFQNLLPKCASKTCFQNVLPKRASKMCFQNVLPKCAHPASAIARGNPIDPAGGGYATFPSVPSGIRHCPGQSIRIRKRIRTRLNACSLRATAIPLGKRTHLNACSPRAMAIPLGKRTHLNAGGSQKCFQNAFKLNPGVFQMWEGPKSAFKTLPG